MRIFCAAIALSIGSIVLIPESAEACHRRGAYRGGYGYAVAPAPYYGGGYYQPAMPYAYSQPGMPGYYQPAMPGYYPPGAYPGAPMTTLPPAGGSPPTPMPGAGATATVNMTDDKFEPASLTVAPGTTVRWTNKGTHKHTVTATNGDWDSGDLGPGQGYSATFSKSGTYQYYCKHHKDMKGTIVVK